MATKPTDLPEWASGMLADIVNPTGAKKALGWVTGEKPPAQYFNWLLNNIYMWAIWLQAYEDEAHVWSKHQSFNEGITATRTLANNHAVTATGNGTGAGVFSRGGSSGVGTRGEGMGATAPGIDGYGDTTGGTGGAGVRGTGGTGNAGILGTGNASGPGTSGIGGGTGGIGAQGVGGGGSGYGVHGTGGSPNGGGVRGVGTGTGKGVEGVGATTADGVCGTGGSTSGIGVRGIGGSPNGVGVRAEGTGTGTGLTAQGGVTDANGIEALGTGSGKGIIATGGNNNGPGVRGIGGSTDGPGVHGFGSGTAPGVYGEGGGSNGAGVWGKGGTTSGPGVKAEKTGAGVAIEAIGDIRTDSHVILGSSDSGTSTPNPTVQETYAGRDSIIYGWARIPSAGTTTSRGKNVFSVARPATGQYVITMNTSLGDDDNVSFWFEPETADVSHSATSATVGAKLTITVNFRTIGAIPVAVNTAFRFGVIGT